jgi:hypothetical protein
MTEQWRERPENPKQEEGGCEVERLEGCGGVVSSRIGTKTGLMTARVTNENVLDK